MSTTDEIVTDTAGGNAVEKARSVRGGVNFHAGRAAEAQVAQRYQEQGCPIIAERWRGSAGEIDLVARDGNGLVFIEVKKSTTFDAAVARVSRRQMQRIYGAASEFLATEPLGQRTEVRFDVALVNAMGDISIIRHAFGHD